MVSADYNFNGPTTVKSGTILKFGGNVTDGFNGRIAERNDDELAVDHEAVGDGTLAHGLQSGARPNQKMNTEHFIIQHRPLYDPFKT